MALEGSTKTSPPWLAFAGTYGLSCVAASTAEISTFPLDVAKTRLQVQGSQGVKANTNLGMVGMLRRIVAQEGIGLLYHGIGAACMRHCVYSGIRVAVYEKMRDDVLGKEADGSFPLWKGIVAGLTAGAVGQAIASPTDLVKVNMQVDGRRLAEGKAPRFKSSWHAATALRSETSILGLWRGVVPNCQRAALVQLGDLTTYDFAKRTLLRNGIIKEDGPVLHICSSACAGFVAATMGAPADVVKTRVMQQPVDPATGKGKFYKGALDCLVKTVRNEGIFALYKGWVPTYLRMAPWSFIYFVTFEQLRRAAGMSSF